ncbi:hypothetical protein HYPSUDRAFT_208366 [Hypholoma sublateritium FD-334 SS-4]|uniref:Uncharacterized protein n=1 Tax=Hypholoma sublateritium (strain FD-334 SS-4) TaxID=945553 RepID=A0A0D2KJP5_HYPSF|nr:hypothetical protein HYPSUDRAFT_208366 [Hypholoma sublateritium FD-334 SS-4]
MDLETKRKIGAELEINHRGARPAPLAAAACSTAAVTNLRNAFRRFVTAAVSQPRSSPATRRPRGDQHRSRLYPIRLASIRRLWGLASSTKLLKRGARLLNDDGLTTARICGSHQRWGGDIESNRWQDPICARTAIIDAAAAFLRIPGGAHQRDRIFEPAIRSPTCLGRRGGVQRREERPVVRRSQRIHHGAQLLHIRAVALLTAAHSAPGALSLRLTSWAPPPTIDTDGSMLSVDEDAATAASLASGRCIRHLPPAHPPILITAVFETGHLRRRHPRTMGTYPIPNRGLSRQAHRTSSSTWVLAAVSAPRSCYPPAIRRSRPPISPITLNLTRSPPPTLLPPSDRRSRLDQQPTLVARRPHTVPPPFAHHSRLNVRPPAGREELPLPRSIAGYAPLSLPPTPTLASTPSSPLKPAPTIDINISMSTMVAVIIHEVWAVA